MFPDSVTINNIAVNALDFPQDEKRFLFLAKKDKIDFIYNTAALEGNAMTYPEVATLLEGITVGGHKLSDEQQILNQNRSVELLFELITSKHFSLDKKTLCTLHAQVAREEALSWGQFRDGNVNIGGTEYRPPSPAKLDDIFNRGVATISAINHPIIAALTYFLFGSRTQFFFDGNKRVSRLVMNGMLLSHGYPVLNIKVKDRLEFNQQMIMFYNTGNFVPAIEYLRDYYIRHNSHIRS
ncbi:MAG: Fic family protein [Desulfuromusa sp.]|jgi:Fic family protein|nr:Fic family protein [Desulfuromusa sp.]